MTKEERKIKTMFIELSNIRTKRSIAEEKCKEKIAGLVSKIYKPSKVSKKNSPSQLFFEIFIHSAKLCHSNYKCYYRTILSVIKEVIATGKFTFEGKTKTIQPKVLNLFKLINKKF